MAYLRINEGLISCNGQLCNIVCVFATPVLHSAIHRHVTALEICVSIHDLYECVFLSYKWRRYFFVLRVYEQFMLHSVISSI